MKSVRQGLLVLGILFACASFAQENAGPVPGYVVDIELQTEEDLAELLSRAERLFLAGELSQDGSPGVTLVLHGPVLRSLMRASYLESREMVDQAASLSALGVVRLQACRSWLGNNGHTPDELQPFVGLVSYGPDEVGRLIREEGFFVF